MCHRLFLVDQACVRSWRRVRAAAQLFSSVVRLVAAPKAAVAQLVSPSATYLCHSLYNRLQTSGVVLVDCRKDIEFSLGYLLDALYCPHVHMVSHLSALSCVRKVAKTVDDVLELTENERLRKKLARRDLIEVVVIGGNHTSASFLYRLDWGYRFAKMLIDEYRVFLCDSSHKNFQPLIRSIT